MKSRTMKIDPRARTIRLAEVERLQAIERQARWLLAYEYPRPNAHPTHAGRAGWGALAKLLGPGPWDLAAAEPFLPDLPDEQQTERSAAP